MEILGTRSDLMTRMSYIYCILSFYDYTYESVKIIRQLCTQSRKLWIEEQNAIINMFTKQTIVLKRDRMDEKTLEVLKKGDRYKLFKFIINFGYKTIDKFELITRIIDEFENIEITKISEVLIEN